MAKGVNGQSPMGVPEAPPPVALLPRNGNPLLQPPAVSTSARMSHFEPCITYHDTTGTRLAQGEVEASSFCRSIDASAET